MNTIIPAHTLAYETPLQHAADQGLTDSVRTLLAAGASPNEMAQWKKPPLSLAAGAGFDDIVELLVQAGADVNQQDNYEDTALDKVALFNWRSTSEKISRLLLGRGATITNTALNQAVTSKPELLRLFLDYGIDPNHRCQDGTLYTIALRVEAFAATRLLRQKGADIYLGRDLPFHVAVLHGEDAVKTFLSTRQGNINEQDLDGTTPLIAALEQGSIKVAELLLHSGADPSIKTRRNVSALQLAILTGADDFSLSLIERGADFNEEDKDGGWNGLWNAALMARVTLVAKLLQRGARWDTRSKTGYSLLAMVKMYRPRHKKAIQQLIQQNMGAHACCEQSYAKAFKRKKAVDCFFPRREQGQIDNSFSRSESAARILAKTVRAFPFEDTELAHELFYMLQFASDQRSHTAKEFLNRIRRGQPTVILTGWREHAVAVLFFNDLFFCCNTGPSGKVCPMTAAITGDPFIPPLQVHTYNRECLDESAIKLLMDGLLELTAERELYAETIYGLLPRHLQFEEDDLCRKIMQDASVQIQTANNCTFTCLEGIVKGFLAAKNQIALYPQFNAFMRLDLENKLRQVLPCSQHPLL